MIERWYDSKNTWIMVSQNKCIMAQFYRISKPTKGNGKKEWERERCHNHVWILEISMTKKLNSENYDTIWQIMTMWKNYAYKDVR